MKGIILLALLGFGCLSLAKADGPPFPGDFDNATVVLPPSPPDGPTAGASFPGRADLYVTYAACLQEDRFLHDLQLAQQTTPKSDRKELKNGADNTDHVILAALAKLQWLKTHPTAAYCTGAFPTTGNMQFTVEQYIENMADAIGYLSTACAAGISFEGAPTGRFIQVSRSCLSAEVNYSLRAIQRGYAIPGTDGLPCNLYEAGTVHGDWDMHMKLLIRALFLDQVGQTGGGPILSATVPVDDNLIFQPVSALSSVEAPASLTTRDYIMQQLITVDGQSGADSYAWEGCGDNEYATGSPQDREDEHEGADNIWNSIGDFFTWFLRRIVPVLVVVGVGGTLLALGVDPLLVTIGSVAALAAVLTSQIPETENHRLMIESTRFLNNQLIIEALGPDNASKIEDGQASVKGWLLTRFQQIAKGDFTEYNARPYHGFSMESLRNLADFATDADVRNGAEMLIDYSAAKYALGSSQGRRQAPFRRHFGVVDCLDGRPCPDMANSATDTEFTQNTSFADMFNDFYQLGDADVAEGTLFLGLREQLPNGQPNDPLVRYALAAATARFRPPDFITDLAIVKSKPYVQKIHHAAFEVYSSGPSTLITAGGILGPHAASFDAPDISITKSDDLGAGVPTSLMFPSNTLNLGGSSLDRFFSFRGSYNRQGNDGTFTDNLCVGQNFACGTNLQIPSDAASCLNPPISLPNNQHWLFMDSQDGRCSHYASSPHFFLALYVICAAGADCKQAMTVPVALDGISSAGFIEVADIGTTVNKQARKPPFERFQDQVLAANPLDANGDIPGLGAGCLNGGTCTGTYHSSNSTFSRSGVVIALRGHADDSNGTGIVSVDGTPTAPLSSWPLADGDIIQSQGDGVIALNNLRLGAEIILDFSNFAHPCHRSSVGAPCIQD